MKTMKFLEDLFGITEPWKVVNNWQKAYASEDPTELTEADMLPLGEVELRLAKLWREMVQNSELNDREKEVILSYYGIGSQEESLAEIGERYGVTGASISEAKKRAMTKLRRSSYRRKYMLGSCVPFFWTAQQARFIGYGLEMRVGVPLRVQLQALEEKVTCFNMTIEALTSSV